MWYTVSPLQQLEVPGLYLFLFHAGKKNIACQVKCTLRDCFCSFETMSSASADLCSHCIHVCDEGFYFSFCCGDSKKNGTHHPACMSVLETLARKQELFLVQILLLRVCCCKNYDYVPSLFSPLLRRGMPDRSVALHKL